MRAHSFWVAAFLMSAGYTLGCASDEDTKKPAPPPLDPEEFFLIPKSCAYICPNTTCPEFDKPYACPAMGDWSAIPHQETCPAWDQKPPAPVAGQCKATAPTGDALKHPGVDAQKPNTIILPDGRTVTPAGKEWKFELTDVLGGMTSGMTSIPGTPYVLTVDIGNQEHAVRAIDTSKIGQTNPVTGIVKFTSNQWLDSGITFVPPGRVYVAAAFGVVQALALDSATGALTKDDAESLMLPPDGADPFVVSSVAATPDGKTLVVSSVLQRLFLVYDIDSASPSYKQLLGQVDLGNKDTFGVYIDPHDATGKFAYVPMWGDGQVLEIDLTNRAAPKISRKIKTEHNPQGIAFLDGRWMVVANDLGESISLVDRVSGNVLSIPVDFEAGHKGLDVSGLAWDETNQRLYALLAGINAVGAYDVNLVTMPPTIKPAGRLVTSWWPSGIVTHPDGSISVTNLRGQPIGAYNDPVGIGGGNGDYEMAGSIQQIAKPSPVELTDGESAVAQAIAVDKRMGLPTIDCPQGVKDFPIPATNEEGPSNAIKHVVFIVRENKTFDALLGDLPGVDGDPKLTMKATTAEMDLVWKNFRTLAREFTVSDNFYNLAVKSTQGHQWTTYGRTTDFCERTWSADYRPVPFCGITAIGRPDEGSVFDWLQRGGVRYSILGEIVGGPSALPPDYNPIDVRYPGGPYQNIEYNDLEKSCYFAARERVACDLGSFVYMTLPNDHTVGISPDNPTPETMVSVNDEATGMVIDALARSPFWGSSLVIITEDDPQQGGDHIDYHRTPLVVVSPWVKRKYVSKTHIDVASLHKLFAHIFGLPYNNLSVAHAALPLDMFTSTPDFTPYSFSHREWTLACGDKATKAEAELTQSWDFKNVDNQPGLGDQVMRWMRGKQYDELPPRIRAEVDARHARKAQGLPVDNDDDD